MEKKIWVAPMAVVEQFAANEYIAACNDTTHKYYNFVCDAGGGVYGDVYNSSGKNLTPDWTILEGYDDWGRPVYDVIDVRGYHACGISHYVKVDDADFITGRYVSGVTLDSESKYYSGTDVVIWTEGGTNVHCTKALEEDIQIVQGNKS